jgi:hypothetical protein
MFALRGLEETERAGRFFFRARLLELLRVLAATFFFAVVFRRTGFFFADFFFADFFGVTLTDRTFFATAFLPFFLAAIMAAVYHRVCA